MRRRTMRGREAIALVLLLPLLLAGCSRPGSTPKDSGEPSQSPVEPTQTTAPGNAVLNGRIQQVQKYLARAGARPAFCKARRTCDEISFDQDSRTLLVQRFSPRGITKRLRVVSSDGQVARLTCPDDFPCPARYPGHGHVETLGPEPDELSVWGPGYWSADETVQVLAFDGTVRRTIDLSTVVTGRDEAVPDLVWSPDGTRLAVTTHGREREDGVLSGHIWLVDTDGGEPQRVYSTSYAEERSALAGLQVLDGFISNIAWSPDGSRLGFVQTHTGQPRPRKTPIRAVSLQLPKPGAEGPGTVRTLYEDALTLSEWYETSEAFLWSPDGTRVAVRTRRHVLELSAEDGSVLATHPLIEGWLIWPARAS